MQVAGNSCGSWRVAREARQRARARALAAARDHRLAERVVRRALALARAVRRGERLAAQRGVRVRGALADAWEARHDRGRHAARRRLRARGVQAPRLGGGAALLLLGFGVGGGCAVHGAEQQRREARAERSACDAAAAPPPPPAPACVRRLIGAAAAAAAAAVRTGAGASAVTAAAVWAALAAGAAGGARQAVAAEPVARWVHVLGVRRRVDGAFAGSRPQRRSAPALRGLPAQQSNAPQPRHGAGRVDRRRRRAGIANCPGGISRACVRRHRAWRLRLCAVPGAAPCPRRRWVPREAPVAPLITWQRGPQPSCGDPGRSSAVRERGARAAGDSGRQISAVKVLSCSGGPWWARRRGATGRPLAMQMMQP